MGYFGIIGDEGRVILPQPILDHLRLKPGDSIEFVVEDKCIVIRPTRPENPFEKYRGILNNFPGGDEEINAWIADMRDDDET